MKILFVTTRNPEKQGDYLELSLLHGLKTVLGDDCVDYPKKKIIYGDYSESPKNTLHGRGFSLLSQPLDDYAVRDSIEVDDFDAVLHGSGHMYGEITNINHRNIWHTDGHDRFGYAARMITHNKETIIGTQFTDKCFKRELLEYFPTVFPTSFGIPEHCIREINYTQKTQLFQITAPSDACFYENSAYRFDDENLYYEDMQKSWFGLSCRKGGYDSLRNYEIIAAGALLLYRDFDQKSLICEPTVPALSYSTPEELFKLMGTLVVNNTPTPRYIELLEKQRKWLVAHGTTRARAEYIIDTITRYS